MDLLFPFERIRSVQLKMIEDLKKIISEKKHLIAHAPTGIGKTAAVISVALSYSIKNGKDVIFLTPRHTQHQIVVDTLKKIKKKFNIKIIAVDFIGKRWMCPIPGVSSLSIRDFNEYCHYIRKEERCSFYNKIWRKSKLSEKAINLIKRLKEESPMHVEDVIQICSSNEICPYYILLELAKESNFLIVDYYHLFHPNIRNAFLIKTGKILEDCILIIDEAQNLPDRIRDVLSSKISNYTVSLAIKEARKFNQLEIAAEINSIADFLNNLNVKKEEYVNKEEFIKSITDSIGRDYESFTGDLLLIGEQIRIENKKSFVGSIGNFLQDWINVNEGYSRIAKVIESKEKKKIELNLICLDPGISSKDVFKSCHSAILMSGTLTPTRMYRDLLRMEERRTICREYPSQFPKSNQLSLIVPETTTKFTRRRKEEFLKIAELCSAISNAIPGNVAIFFPSYELKDEVVKIFKKKSLKDIFVEKRGMGKREKAKLLSRFKEYADIGAVFLGVVTGSFGEGIDLPGKYLNGVIVVGIPLEKPDLKTQALIDYYDKLFGAGWNYGYIYPAMNRAIQACGRVIRSESDRGVVVLLDERFVWKNYFKCLPVNWKIYVTKDPVKKIKEFFRS